MSNLFHQLAMLRADRRAVTALEYGLIAAAVVAIGLAGFSLVGDDLKTKMDSVSTQMAETPPS